MGMAAIEYGYLLMTTAMASVLVYSTWKWHQMLDKAYIIGITAALVLIYPTGTVILFGYHSISTSLQIAELFFALTLCLLLILKIEKKWLLTLIAFVIAHLLLLHEYYAFFIKGYNEVFSLHFLSNQQLTIAGVAAFIVVFGLFWRSKNHRKVAPVFLIMVAANIMAYQYIDFSLLFASVVAKGLFYLFVAEYVINSVKEDIKSTQKNADKIKKNFQDELRKEVNKHTFSIEMSKEKIKTKSKIDDLTKAYMKKAILDEMEKLISQKVGFCMLIFDIDKFKTLNDTLGHIVGDKCLKQLVQIANTSIREQDIIGRYGGDEFFIVLPEADLTTARVIGERLRYNIEKNSDPRYTISIGIASYPHDATTVIDLIEHADRGLYQSKERGRNKVSHA